MHDQQEQIFVTAILKSLIESRGEGQDLGGPLSDDFPQRLARAGNAIRQAHQALWGQGMPQAPAPTPTPQPQPPQPYTPTPRPMAAPQGADLQDWASWKDQEVKLLTSQRAKRGLNPITWEGLVIEGESNPLDWIASVDPAKGDRKWYQQNLETHRRAVFCLKMLQNQPAQEESPWAPQGAQPGPNIPTDTPF